MKDNSHGRSIDWVLCVLIFALGVLVGAGIVSETFKRESIERGYAEYNSTNGNWQWKENTPRQ